MRLCLVEDLEAEEVVFESLAELLPCDFSAGPTKVRSCDTTIG